MNSYPLRRKAPHHLSKCVNGFSPLAWRRYHPVIVTFGALFFLVVALTVPSVFSAVSPWRTLTTENAIPAKTRAADDIFGASRQ